MKSCIAIRGARTPILCHGRARLPLTLLRPIVSVGSVSTPAERGHDGKAPVDAQHEQQSQKQSNGVPSTIEGTDSTPVVAIKAEPSTSEPSAAVETEPSTSGTEEEEGREEKGDASQTRLAAHPLEDVPEEVEEDLIASKELVAEVMDGSSFGKRGEQWLFAQVAAIAMLLFPPLALKGLVDFSATLSLTAGLVFIVTAIFNLGRNISPLPEPRKKHHLVVSGIYGYVRHPMYGGLLLAAFGLAILTRNETRLALVALLWWVLENKVAMEERALSERYPEYAEYKAKVKKFFPSLY